MRFPCVGAYLGLTPRRYQSAYMTGPLLTSTGPAAAFIQSTLAYTAAQMNALFALAATFPC